MRKLYTQYTNSESNTPFMVTFEGNQVQACANDGDTITIGSTEYVRVTDGQGHDVKAVIPNSGDEAPHKLIVRLGEGNTHDLCYIEGDGVASSASIQVTDIEEERYVAYDFEVYKDSDIEVLKYIGDPSTTVPIPDYWELEFNISQPTITESGNILNVLCKDLTLIKIENTEMKFIDSLGTQTIGYISARDNLIEEYISKIKINSKGAYELTVTNISTEETTIYNNLNWRNPAVLVATSLDFLGRSYQLLNRAGSVITLTYRVY